MSPIRRDAEGQPEASPTWESLADRQIREAQERGEFANLPYHGRPLPRVDETYAGDKATAFGILRNNGAAPAWIEADKEARRLLEERDSILRRAANASPMMRGRYRAELSRVVQAYNRQVTVLSVEAPSYRQHRPWIDEATALEALEDGWSRAIPES